MNDEMLSRREPGSKRTFLSHPLSTLRSHLGTLRSTIPLLISFFVYFVLQCSNMLATWKGDLFMGDISFCRILIFLEVSSLVYR